MVQLNEKIERDEKFGIIINIKRKLSIVYCPFSRASGVGKIEVSNDKNISVLTLEKLKKFPLLVIYTDVLFLG